MPNPMPTNEQVLDALKKVKFPGLSRDIVSFGFVRDVVITGDVVSFTIHFQTENPAVGQQIARDAEAAVRALEGVRDVRVNLEIGAKTGGSATGGAIPAQPNALEGVKYKHRRRIGQRRRRQVDRLDEPRALASPSASPSACSMRTSTVRRSR
jgi:metal-sulfur cluster biosynthetic enzyme